MLTQQLHLAPPSRLPTLTTFPHPRNLVLGLVAPEKQNLLDLAGSQSRAEFANDQLQEGKHPLCGRGKKKRKRKWNKYLLQQYDS